jgi:hypothetical protein
LDADRRARKPLAVKGDVLAYLRSRHGRCFAGVPNLQSVPNAIRFGEELEGRIAFSTRPDRVDYHIHDRIDLGADEAVVIAPMPVARLRSADGGARDPWFGARAGCGGAILMGDLGRANLPPSNRAYRVPEWS